ncbi:MAG: flagellar type III secretion system pore protein FliP [Candidatus Muirbacterium halophilum]|nr:flagellar type III secretion system pore protein FliP [Candidatus Muirbacterium halophilum]
MNFKKTLFILIILFIGFNTFAEDNPNFFPIPKLNFDVQATDNPEEISLGLQIVFLLTILALAPSILIMTTCFTRVVIVLSFVRRAIATQSIPSNQIVIGLAIFVTFYIMAPVWTEMNDTAIQPYIVREITQPEAIDRAIIPLRKFMIAQTRNKDLAMFVKYARGIKPKNIDEVPTHVIIPAFIVSELKTSFQMGILLFLPFLIVDITVASILMSMGMMMLPPVMISLPFKLIIFVMADGWNLVIDSLVRSFRV